MLTALALTFALTSQVPAPVPSISASPASADKPAASTPKDDKESALRARLAKGEIIVTTRKIAGSDTPEATLKAVIDAPPEKVWALVSDCASYKKTMPNIAESALLDSTPGDANGDGATRLCRVVADLPFPLQDLVSVSKGVHSIVPGHHWQRTWKMVEGDYEANTGMWRVEPFDAEGKRSMVTYVINARPKIMLPSGLVSAVSTGKLPEMIEGIRKQVR